MEASAFPVVAPGDWQFTGVVCTERPYCSTTCGAPYRAPSFRSRTMTAFPTFVPRVSPASMSKR